MNVRAAWSSCLLFVAMLFGAGTALADGSLVVTPASVAMLVGAKATLTATNVANQLIVSAGDASIVYATVSRRTVTLSARKAGATTVTVKDSLSERKILVTVNPVPVLTVNPTAVTMAVGATAPVAVTNASGTVTATSASTAIATVTYANNTATVKGVKAGATTITIKDSKTSRTVAATVTAAGPALAMSPSFVSITAGATVPLAVTNAAGAVTVSTSDASVATVTYASGKATVKGIKAGGAVITARDGTTSAVTQVTVVSGPVPVAGGYALLAWNDLGMHCVDGKDYSVFSILPPYNNLHAQLVNKSTGKQVTTGVTLTYEAIPDDTVPVADPMYSSINTTSIGKTNFWTYVQGLFGANPAPDVGLNLSGLPGNRVTSKVPQPMTFAPANGWFVAEGIPMTPVDDQGRKNFYPMVKVVAKDIAGNVLATAKTVLPVSDEMTCIACHASTQSLDAAANAARPKAGWVNNPVAEKDWKMNILKLHDERMFANPATAPLYAAALAQMGYDAGGLLVTTTRQAGEPVLCAACHSSNALATSGFPNVRALTHALHTKHADVVDPTSQLALSSINNRSACYSCHPGSVTQCLRGAMGTAVDANGKPEMSCQSCHGNMLDVGNTARTGWLSQPNCQACHHDGVRELVGVTAAGTPKVWSDTRFATAPNTPAAGFSLYRFSKGHGGLQCEACHGATHAEYPSSHSQDNALSIGLQGHAGTVAECAACHATMPTTVSGGPHGMHTTGAAWVSSHEDVSKTGCTDCHGKDYRGTPLSAIKVAKVINGKSFAAGHPMNCYDCHNGPNP